MRSPFVMHRTNNKAPTGFRRRGLFFYRISNTLVPATAGVVGGGNMRLNGTNVNGANAGGKKRR